MRELTNIVKEGGRAVLFYCVQHTGIKEVRIAEHVDAKYAQLCREAVAQGVEVMAWVCDINPQKIELNQSLPVNI